MSIAKSTPIRISLSAMLLFCCAYCLGAAHEIPAIASAIEQFTGTGIYRHASWGIAVADASTGEVLYSQNADKLFAPASTTKLFSTAAALMDIGPGFRFVTPVYLSPSANSDGTLVLRASGDPNLSGRIDANGHLAFTNEDHIYAEFSSNATLTATDPLSGIDDLARQIRDAGIKRVTDVLVDDRLFETAEGSGSGPSKITPVVVNDNIFDILVTPTQIGLQAKVETRPQTSYAQWDIDVQTAAAGGPTNVTVEEIAPRRLSVRGQIAAGHAPVLGISAVDDPASFARTLLIERLQALGLTVERSRFAEMDRAQLPTTADYGRLRIVARHTSPPFSEALKVILKTSHNLGAGMLPLLIAVHHGKRTHDEGMLLEANLLDQIGVDTRAISFSGGVGGGRADFVTPNSVVSLLLAMSKRPEFGAYLDSLPVLGVDGTLADAVPESSPARGHVSAKTGTLVWENALDGNLLLLSKALSGYMTAHSGRKLIVVFYVNNVAMANSSGVEDNGKALGHLCEMIYNAF